MNTWEIEKVKEARKTLDREGKRKGGNETASVDSPPPPEGVSVPGGGRVRERLPNGISNLGEYQQKPEREEELTHFSVLSKPPVRCQVSSSPLPSSFDDDDGEGDDVPCPGKLPGDTNIDQHLLHTREKETS